MKKLKSTQAFTVIELATVLVIILIISGLIVGASSKIREVALETKTESMIAALEVAISMYHADTGGYPPDTDAVVGSTPSAVLYDYLRNTNHQPDGDGTITYPEVDGWRGPYMEFKVEDLGSGSDEVVDPWGEPYRYKTAPVWGNKSSYNLWSTGIGRTNDSGGADDTDFGDDIYNW